MGVYELWPLVRKNGYDPSQASLAHQRHQGIVGLDASSCFYTSIQRAYSTHPPDRAAAIFERALAGLVGHLKASVVCYLDGEPALEKAAAHQAREKRRSTALDSVEAGMVVLRNQVHNLRLATKQQHLAVRKKLGTSFTWSLEDRQHLQQYLQEQGWVVILSSCEADVEIARDCQEGDVVLTTDSDFLAYSRVQTVWRLVTRTELLVYDIPKLLKTVGLTRAQLTALCIVSKNDYDSNVLRLGTITNFKLLKSITRAETVEQYRRHRNTDITFELSQRVFDTLVQTAAAPNSSSSALNTRRQSLSPSMTSSARSSMEYRRRPEPCGRRPEKPAKRKKAALDTTYGEIRASIDSTRKQNLVKMLSVEHPIVTLLVGTVQSNSHGVRLSVQNELGVQVDGLDEAGSEIAKEVARMLKRASRQAAAAKRSDGYNLQLLAYKVRELNAVKYKRYSPALLPDRMLSTTAGTGDYLTEVLNVFKTPADVKRLLGCTPNEVDQVSYLGIDLGQAFIVGAHAYLPANKNPRLSRRRKPKKRGSRGRRKRVARPTLRHRTWMEQQKCADVKPRPSSLTTNTESAAPSTPNQPLSSDTAEATPEVLSLRDIESAMPHLRGDGANFHDHAQYRKEHEDHLASFYNGKRHRFKNISACPEKPGKESMSGSLIRCCVWWDTVGGTIGERRKDEDKVVIGVGLGQFTSTSRLSSLHGTFEAYFIAKARSSGYLVIGVNAYYTYGKYPWLQEDSDAASPSRKRHAEHEDHVDTKVSGKRIQTGATKQKGKRGKAEGKGKAKATD
ncbi:unnamed protein product [Mortierella alpina]